MKILNSLKLTKPRIINSAGVYLVYLFFTYLQSFQCCMDWLLCVEEAPRRIVLSIYPGAWCCQVCATTNQLILGYALMILLRIILPAIAIYVFVSLTPSLVKKLSKELSD